MNRKGDREILVDSPTHQHFANHDQLFTTSNNVNHDPARGSSRTTSWKDACSTSKQLNLIYIGIIAILAAVSIAEILTIFFGPPQVTPHAFIVSDNAYCSYIGKKIMTDKKGNAVDSLVSMVLCLSVTRPDIIGEYSFIWLP